MEGYALAEAAPSFFTRRGFWRRLGFGRPAIPELEESEDFADGAIITETITIFSWKDRLRILISGKTFSITRMQTDVMVKKARSASNTRVLPPGAIAK